jgi:hypothetical protein
VMALFEKGHKPLPGSGRAKGVKNRLSHAFLTALVEDFEQHGAEAIKICRVERPNEYVKIVAGLMPRELDITNNTLTDIDDSQLVEFIEYIRLQLGERTQRIASRADTETDGRPLEILPPISKTT